MESEQWKTRKKIQYGTLESDPGFAEDFLGPKGGSGLTEAALGLSLVTFDG
jgi:hypothetical protein